MPDINLLLYAYDPESRFRETASAWWLRAMRGTEPVGIAIPVALGFVRLSTRRFAFREPLTVRAATAIVRDWTARPQVQVLAVEPAHFVHALALLDTAGAAGNLVGDAVRLRWPWLTTPWFAPLTPTSRASNRRSGAIRWPN